MSESEPEALIEIVDSNLLCPKCIHKKIIESINKASPPGNRKNNEKSYQFGFSASAAV